MDLENFLFKTMFYLSILERYKIRKFLTLSKLRAHDGLFWQNNIFSFDLLFYHTSEWIIMLQKLRNV